MRFAVTRTCLAGVPLVLAVLAASSSLAQSPRIHEPEQPQPWAVYFSPGGGATQAVVDTLGLAKETVLVQAPSLTSTTIVKALVAARQRGVKVEVILDRKQAGSRSSIANTMTSARIRTLIDGAHAIADNRAMVIDSQVILTGSFNFTTAAEHQNAESLLVVHDAMLAARYTENWQLHAAHSVTYNGR